MDLKKKGPGRPSLSSVVFPQNYSAPRALKPGKVKDCLDLLMYVPPVHHPFYLSLRSSSDGTEEGDETFFDGIVWHLDILHINGLFVEITL